VAGEPLSQIIEQCPSCESRDLKWEQDNGWITRPVRYLRCQTCSDCVRISASGRIWIAIVIVSSAALLGWLVTR
jgi:hypothetical protein